MNPLLARPDQIRALCGEGLVFDEGPHTYHVQGIVHVPVTTVVELALPENPAKAYFTERHRRLGQVIHEVTRLHDEGRLVIESVAPQVQNRFRAWHRFVSEHPYQTILAELPCWSQLGTAGTCDRLCWYDGKLAVLDVKSWLDETYTALQTAGYSYQIFERTGLVPVVRLGVGLHDDGSYDVKRFDDYVGDRDAWLHAVGLVQWLVKRGKVKLNGGRP